MFKNQVDVENLQQNIHLKYICGIKDIYVYI